MKLKWTPWRVINRFGNRYVADNEWILVATNKEEMEIFVKYGFTLVEELKEEAKTTKKKK